MNLTLKLRFIKLLNLSLSIILLISCADKKEKIVIWTSLRPLERVLLDSLINNFSTSYPQYEFKQLFYAPEELRTNFIISALAGKGPALIHCASDFIGPLSELQIIRNLDDMYTDSLLINFVQNPIQANTYFQSHLYQIADRIGNHLCLVYNKSIVKSPPNSISELIAMRNKYVRDTDGDGQIDSYVLAWNYTEPAFVVPFIGGYGGWIIDENNQPTLNTPSVVKAAQLIYDLANKHKIIPKECDYETANALFLDRRVAMIINGPWSWGTYINNGIDIGLARIPMIDETKLWPTPTVFPMGYCFNVNLQNKQLEVTKILVDFLTSPQVILKFARRFNIIPSRKEAFSDSLLQSKMLIQQALDQMEVGRSLPVVTEIRWIFDAMRPAYQSIFTGGISAEEAALNMQLLAERLIKEGRK